MPAIRTLPPVKPLRTERTHEENQERAYIAASRRSDRSLEARVESARRASEIHKKRTGRSLRVREEDVVNEEMYEEEDDDLPMQYRRINALNPHLSYAFAERLNNYVNGQIGVRTALQQAIAQSNQYQQNQQLLNSYMQSSGCYSGSPSTSTPSVSGLPQTPWSGDMQGMPANPHNRSASFASPHDASHFQDRQSSAASQGAGSPDIQATRRMSMPVHDMSKMAKPASSGTTRASPKQIPSPPQSISTPIPSGMPASPSLARHQPRYNVDAQIAPLTTQLPNETLQMLQGPGTTFNPTFFTPDMNMGASPPIGKYSYNPNGSKSSSCASTTDREKPNPFEGLNQTLSLNPYATNSFAEPSSSTHAPPAFDSTFDAHNYPLFSGGLSSNDSYSSYMDYGSSNNTLDMHNSGFVTPSDTLDATFGDFFDFQPSPE